MQPETRVGKDYGLFRVFISNDFDKLIDERSPGCRIVRLMSCDITSFSESVNNYDFPLFEPFRY